MLVLARKLGECVRIGESIEVKVLEIAGGRIKLGFSAPSDVDVQREEIRGTHLRRLERWQACCAAG